MPKNKKKRNANGNGSITKRADGRWEGKYTVPADDGSTRCVRKSVYGKTKEEVRKKLTQIQYEIDNNLFINPTKMTLGSWIDTWLNDYVKHSVKALTYDSYYSLSNNHIKPVLGDVVLTKLTTDRIQKFLNYLLDEKNLSVKTVKNISGVLHKALEQAFIVGHIKANPCNRTQLPKAPKKKIKPMSNENIELFLKTIKSHKFENIYYVTLFTGLREGEVLGLTWDCVDFKNNTILVNKQLKKNTQYAGSTHILSSTKNGEERIIRVAPSVMLVLARHQKIQEKMADKAGCAWNNEWNLVFTNELGGFISHATVYNNFKRIVKQLGIPEMRFHDLRHTYATISLESGDDFKTVQSNLGHATASFTLDVYGHVSDGMKKKSAMNVQQFINKVS